MFLSRLGQNVKIGFNFETKMASLSKHALCGKKCLMLLGEFFDIQAASEKNG